MTTRRGPIRVRPWRAGDVNDLASLANDRDVWVNLRDRFPHPYTRADAFAWVAYNHTDDGPPLHLAFEVDDELVGGGGLTPKEDVYRLTAEIGYWIAKPYWGHGIATEAVRQLTAYAFENFRFERLEAGVFDWNPASARVLEKNDYVFEGRLHRAVIKDGRIGDVLLYARLRGDTN